MSRLRGVLVVAVVAGAVFWLLTACARADLATVRFEGVTVRARIADSVRERTLGLEGSEKPGPEEGMLFVWPDEGSRTFGIKGVDYPLDLIFMDEEGVVVGVAGLDSLVSTLASSPDSSRLVLEVPAGFVERHAIAPGVSARIEGLD